MKPGYLSEIFVSFQGEGARVGERHLFVRLSGCHLRCRYCDTPDSLERTTGFTVHAATGPVDYPNPIEPRMAAELVDALMQQEGPIDAISLTGGEPLTQPRFLVDLLSAARFPVPILLETSGTLPRQLAEVLPYVDIVSMDIKLASNTGEPSFSKEHAEFLAIAADKEIYVKILIDDKTSETDFAAAMGLLETHKGMPVFLQPIVDAGGKAAVAMERLHHFQRLARTQMNHVRVVPQTHKFLGVR